MPYILAAVIVTSVILAGALALRRLRSRRLRIRLARLEVDTVAARPAPAEASPSAGPRPAHHWRPQRHTAMDPEAVAVLVERARELRDRMRNAA